MPSTGLAPDRRHPGVVGGRRGTAGAGGRAGQGLVRCGRGTTPRRGRDRGCTTGVPGRPGRGPVGCGRGTTTEAGRAGHGAAQGDLRTTPLPGRLRPGAVQRPWDTTKAPGKPGPGQGLGGPGASRTPASARSGTARASAQGGLRTTPVLGKPSPGAAQSPRDDITRALPRPGPRQAPYDPSAAPATASDRGSATTPAPAHGDPRTTPLAGSPVSRVGCPARKPGPTPRVRRTGRRIRVPIRTSGCRTSCESRGTHRLRRRNRTAMPRPGPRTPHRRTTVPPPPATSTAPPPSYGRSGRPRVAPGSRPGRGTGTDRRLPLRLPRRRGNHAAGGDRRRTGRRAGIGTRHRHRHRHERFSPPTRHAVFAVRQTDLRGGMPCPPDTVEPP